jgi:hypothetical protein
MLHVLFFSAKEMCKRPLAQTLKTPLILIKCPCISSLSMASKRETNKKEKKILNRNPEIK